MKPLPVIAIAMLLMGCEKHNKDYDTELRTIRLTAPMIRLTSPRDYQRFSAGQIVSITATITDDNQLHKVRLRVSKPTGARVLLVEKYLDTKSYNLSESFTMTEGPQHIIEIETVDHNNNKAKTRIEVSCN